MKLLKYAGFVPYLAIAFINGLVVLTALINAMILLPFIFLFSPSAFINDKFSRTNVIRYSSLAAVVISAGILVSYMTGMFALSFVLTLILAAQSAVYSPAKYSIIKSIVGTENIGMANGVIQALTIVAILFSSFAFSFFFEAHYVASDDPNEVLQSVWVIGVALVLLSALEAYFAFKIPFFKQEAENTEGQFDMRKYLSLGYLKDNVRTLKADQNIWLSVIGLSLFWGVSQIIVAAFPAHYKAMFNEDNAVVIQAILAVSGIGLALGSYLAGRASRLHRYCAAWCIGYLCIIILLNPSPKWGGISTLFFCLWFLWRFINRAIKCDHSVFCTGENQRQNHGR
ncbi:MAG: MFS transporter [Haemophilus parainfluenzae]|nr:MFS transporter [Haemophilus parainfluenzae]